jgi:hypothetical protein
VPAPERPQPPRLTLLREGEVELQGRLPWSSNYTFLAKVTLGDDACLAVYKPLKGERPLWDFEPGLFRREIAAYEVSEALGWRLVPETVRREDAPMGDGSMQWFVDDVDYDQHYFTLLELPEHHDALVTICAFDVLINNADRKGGHCLLDYEGHIWAVDHGLAFHAEPKLRTVIWEFSGQPIPRHVVDDIECFASNVPDAVAAQLDVDELEALKARARAIVHNPVLPAPLSGRPYPWPLV